MKAQVLIRFQGLVGGCDCAFTGLPTNLADSRSRGPTTLAVGAGRGCSNIFPSLWETT